MICPKCKVKCKVMNDPLANYCARCHWSDLSKKELKQWSKNISDKILKTGITLYCPHCLEEDIHTKSETNNEVQVSHDETKEVPEYDYCPKCKYNNQDERADEMYDAEQDFKCQ